MRKGRILCFLAVLAVAACGQSTGRAASDQSPSATVSAAGQSAQPSSAPSPSPALSPSPSAVAADLTCRLPVVTEVNGDMVRGWVTFPGGKFAQDPAILRNADNNHMPSYDWAIGAWVPVEQNDLAPNGASYVLELNGDQVNPPVGHALYIVDATSGKRRLILSTGGPGPGLYWSGYTPGLGAPDNYATDGVYLAAVGGGSDVPEPVPGLWLLNPLTSSVRLIDASHYWDVIGDGFAWTADDPVVAGTATKIYRLDLATGQVVVWYKSKKSVRLISATAEGGLLIGYGEEEGQGQLAVLDASHALTLLDSPPNFGADWGSVLAQPGVWIAVDGGVALYMKGAGVRVMALSSSGNVIYPAGACR